MNWLDRPFSPRTRAFLSIVGLGFCAWMLAQVGMSTFRAIGFATLIATSVGGFIDYAVTART